MTLTFYENNKYNLPIIGRPRFQLTSFVVQKNRWILRNSVASRKVSVKPSENLLKILESLLQIDTAQEMKFSINDFFSKSDQIRRKLQIWSHLLKKSLMENFIFFAVVSPIFAYLKNQELYELTLNTKKKTNRQNILLTGTDHCNSKVFKNIQF